MSFSPSFPQGAPTLAEVLLQRTFAKPPEPFVDGELTRALATAGPAVTVAIQATAESGSGSADAHTGGSDTETSDASTPSSDGDGGGRSVDVRV